MGCYDLTTYFTVVSACLTIILTTVLIFILFQIKKSFLAFQSLFQHYEEEHNTVQIDKSQLTSYELERLEREEEFDKRIADLKQEVSKQSDVIRRGVTAEELHPLVHNLPHNAVQTKYDLSDYEEVAE